MRAQREVDEQVGHLLLDECGKLGPGVDVVGVGGEHLHRGLGTLEALVVFEPVEERREGAHEHQPGHGADGLHQFIHD